MRQTVTLFRSRYEGSNPSHLKRGTFASDEKGVLLRRYEGTKERRKQREKTNEMKGVDQETVKRRRKQRRKRPSVTGESGLASRSESRRERRNLDASARKEVKQRYPHYVRGVPRRPRRTVEKALQKVYGVGRRTAKQVGRACGRSPRVRVGNRDRKQVQLREGWRRENVRCSSDRRRVEYEAVSRHLKLGTVRGINRRRGLPVRGQRTSTNGMTARRLNKQRGTKVR